VHVDFINVTDDVRRGRATTGTDGVVVYTTEPGQRLPTFLTDGSVGITDDGHTFLTVADGDRFLGALPSTYRSEVFLARLVED
jgi:hypothetical protein